MLATAAVATAQPADPAKQRPTIAVRNCTTAGCHADQLQHKLLHGPTAVGACDVCHQVKDPGQHTFLLKREGKALCTFCHIDKTGTEHKFVHKPVADEACTACHNPHGSEVKSMLRQKSVNAQCLQCHTQIMAGSHGHKPAQDDCSSCHMAHSAPHDKLLKTDKQKLCVTCHQDVEKFITTAKHPHKPVAGGDCYSCHSPHSSNNASVLSAGPKDLCISCHQSMGTLINSAAHQHSAATDGKACLNCHSPHGSDHAKQLKSSTLDACMACHDKPIAVDKQRSIAAVNELRVDAFYKHGPINKDDCGACHAVHGGAVPHLLVAPYSAAFYTNKEPDAAALCFKCHDAKLLAGPVGDKQTAFRDGDRNLHALHTGQGQGQQARSCRACHTIHASRFENMVADSVKFGEWSLPLNYVKTPTGGSCAPGCHKAEPYDRQVAGRMPPVDGAAAETPPANALAEPKPAAEREKGPARPIPPVPAPVPAPAAAPVPVPLPNGGPTLPNK